MKKSITLLLLTYSLIVFGQPPPNSLFNQTILETCTFDSTQTILQFQDWQIYQTSNGLWDGPIDSSRCIEIVEYGSNDFEIVLSQIQQDRPLFIRSKLDDSNKILLEPNTLYSSGLWHTLTGTTSPNLTVDCLGGFCSGVIIGIDIPDETGTGRALRINDAPFQLDNFNDFEFCVITEYFMDNFLREFVLQFSFDEISTNSTLRIGSVGIEKVEDYGIIDEIAASPSYLNGSEYQIPLIDFSQGSFWTANMVLLYNAPTYPSPTTPSYVKVSPSPNTDQQEIMNLQIDFWHILTPQPFTYFRGGLIEGSDSLRHFVNLVNNGGNLCLSSIVDLVFDGGTRYVHQGGEIDFVNNFSCIQFLDGGVLEVADDTDLHLGNHGIGALALRQGGSIEIGKNSSLTIDAQVWVNESRGIQKPQQIYMSLNRGSRLTFTENARLSNYGSIDGQMKLNVYMNGGVLDDSQLSPKERALINRIYPSPKGPLAEELELFPNPASNECNISLVLAEEEAVALEIFDIYGKIVYRKQERCSKGVQVLGFPINNLAEGIYWVQVKSGNDQASKKLNIHR